MTQSSAPKIPDPSTFLPMGSMLTHHAQQDPDRPAITHLERTVTRGELEAAANRRARALMAMGVVQDDMVTVALSNSIEFYETAFAIWKLGATPNVVSAKMPDVELQDIVALAKPRVVVGIDPARLPGINAIPAEFQPDSSLSAEALPPKVAKHWKAMASGGSTGRPKLIVDHLPSHWSTEVFMLNQRACDAVLNPGPLYHNAPFSLMSTALFGGSHVIEMGRFDPLQALQLIEKHRVGWVNFVPTMMKRIWDLPAEQRARFDVTSLHTVIHMAAACPAWLKESWINWLGPDRILEIYGGTEAQGRTIITGREWLAHKGSVGKAQAGCKIVVLDEEGHECPPGVVGEIFFLPDGGKNSTYHYVGAEAKTRGDYESIGDLGYTDQDGYLYLADRRTDLIVSGGANIYPAEVEAALEAYPGVRSSVVLGLPDEDFGHRAHAVIEADPGLRGEDLVADIKKFLALRLQAYKVPRSFEFVDHALRDEAGKVRRSAMRDARKEIHFRSR